MGDGNKVTKIAVTVTIAVIIFAAIGIAFFVTGGIKSEEQINAKKSDFITGVINGITNDIQNVVVDNSVENITTTNTTNSNTTNTTNTEALNIPVEEGYTKVNETVWATTTVHVRKTASTNGEILGSLFDEQSVTRVGIGNDGWSKVVYKDAPAYVFSEYLTDQAPPERPKLNVTVRGSNNVDPSKRKV